MPCFPAPFVSLSLLACAALSSAAQSSDAPPGIAWGGHHEYGLLAGYSGHSGPIWGFSKDVHYLPLIARYSWQIRGGRHVALRYAPEVTLLSRLHETTATEVNPYAPMTTYGAGISFTGFQLVLRPQARVQPFLSESAGFIYYANRVLSPQGSQFMYTIDFGAGANYFLSPRNALNLGFRYQHLSNANISIHNPGTDAETFYLGFSHFHTHGVR